MKTKKFDVGLIKMELQPDGFVKGLVLKRDLTIRECKHIVKKCLGIDYFESDCFEEQCKYKEINEKLVCDVNAWLRGKIDDDALLEDYTPDCYYDSIGVMCFVPVILYLKKRGIID